MHNQARATFVVRASLLGILGGAIGTVGATVTQFISSSVSTDLTRYPYAAHTFVLTELLWTLAHILVLVGFVGFVRSDLAGPTRRARIGLRLALVGLVLMIPLEFGFVFAASTKETDAYPLTLSSLFGLATVLIAVGMILAGVATLRTRRAYGWRRFVPLACGLSAVVLMPMQLTGVDLLGIAGFFFTFVILSSAVASRPEPGAERTNGFGQAPEAGPRKARLPVASRGGHGGPRRRCAEGRRGRCAH
jgi:hypothetical protein